MRKIISLYVVFFVFIIGQEVTTKNTESKDAEKSLKKLLTAAPKIKKIEDVVKGKVHFPGLISLYQDSVSGKLFISLKKNQIGKEFIYFVHAEEGQLNTGVFRGNYRGARIIKINRYFNRVEFEIQNSSFYFDPANPLSKASNANISTAVLASEYIAAESDSLIMVSVDNVFLTEALHQISRSVNPLSKNKNPFKLGRLVKNRTKYSKLKNYPKNTDISVQYVYSNPSPTNWGSDAGLTDARSVNVTLQHSFIEMPKNNYTPRYEDPRVGYFVTEITDMTTADDVTPYKDLIHRWHLEKKYPEQFVSVPVEPIVWWIENTTPLEFRDAIKDGVLAWNRAFEKAGFNKALEVKTQPDDADWDAGDIRYNVLRWTSSPNPPFGGYGPSFVNPRTGQIIGADIMLEYVHFTNRVKYERLYEPITTSYDTQKDNQIKCSSGNAKHQGNLFASNVLKSTGRFSSLDEHRLIYESMVNLVLHEIGHTLGLSHNFYSSNYHTLNNIYDRNKTEPVGLTSSVMDYEMVNIGKHNNWTGQYYSTTPGPYDIWAIQYGYESSLKNPVDELARVSKLLSQSTKEELRYGNDADDMRSPGKGVDPRIMIFDMSTDPVGYAEERMDLIRSLFSELRKRYEVPGESYHAFADAFYILNREYRSCLTVISRYVGGLYMDRSMVGQENSELPFMAIPKETQKWAMALLDKYAFSPNAFSVPNDVYNHLQWQRRGWSGTKDHKIHDQVLDQQKNILDHLLHTNVLKRISDSELYGNNYLLVNVFGDLTDACFAADAGTSVNSIRRNLQIEYTDRLIKMVLQKGVKHDNLTISSAYSNLQKILKHINKKYGVDNATKAHREFLHYKITEALDS